MSGRQTRSCWRKETTRALKRTVKTSGPHPVSLFVELYEIECNAIGCVTRTRCKLIFVVFIDERKKLIDIIGHSILTNDLIIIIIVIYSFSNSLDTPT